MNAHDRVERQLRTSVAHLTDRDGAPRVSLRPWSRTLSALLVGSTIAATVAVAAFALIALRHRGQRISPPAASTSSSTATTTHGSSIGPRPRDPGPIPPNVADWAVAAAWNTASAKDPACRGGTRSGAGTGTNNGSPEQRDAFDHPRSQPPAAPADRLPARFYVAGLLRPLEFRGGDVYSRYIRRVRVIDGIAYYLVPSPIRTTAAVACSSRPLLPPDGCCTSSRTAACASGETGRHASLRRRRIRTRPLQPSDLHHPRGPVPVHLPRQRQRWCRWRSGPVNDPTVGDARRRRRGHTAQPYGHGRDRPPGRRHGELCSSRQATTAPGTCRRSAQPVTWSTTYSSSRSQPCSSGAAGRPPQFGAQVPAR